MLDRELMTHIAVKQGESCFKPQQLKRECDVYLSSRGRSTKELINRNAVGEVKRVVGNKGSTCNWRADKNISQIFVSETKNINCVLCKRASHSLSACSQFIQLSVWDRAEVVKRNYLCFRCFSPHKLNECRSVKNCFCLKPHHRMIHFPRENSGNPASHLKLDAPTFVPKQSEETAEANSQSQFVATGIEKGKPKNVLLSSIRALVKNKFSHWVEVRCLLDVGSQSCCVLRRVRKDCN
ncbi:hypothetical protein AVEN_264721-1 [Araneus ventricosus]|uniref:Peptidase aspartic putative domain-containing protein n=1 Tax=Araneus ventricosus TaxID=182803 RepID=A0A4Y2RBB3_ARAVE|nr:hypothetical protein AVEN_264721-1 [Araneus ventricosus]